MKFLALIYVLWAILAVITLAEPNPKPAKAYRLRVAQIVGDDIKNDNYQSIDDFDQLEEAELGANDSAKKHQTSSGRLFLQEFKNKFGQNQKQPIIPIIITGGGNIGPPTTETITSEGTIPTATGTITTEALPPTANAGASGQSGATGNRIFLYGRSNFDENDAKKTVQENTRPCKHRLTKRLTKRSRINKNKRRRIVTV